MLLLQPGNFLLKGLEDMILKHKVKTDKMPVSDFSGRLETNTGEQLHANSQTSSCHKDVINLRVHACVYMHVCLCVSVSVCV